MPGPYIAGTFATGGSPSTGGNASDVMCVPTSRTSMKVTLSGCDASNTCRTQKRASSSSAWVDQTTYNSNQNATPVAVAAGEEWRFISLAQQAVREIRYVLDAQ